jgi:hypothetical protein
MPLVPRLALILALLAVLPLRAAPIAQSEYKQADTSYYLRSDLFSADPAAQVIAPEAATNIGGTYLIPTRGRAPQFVYLQDSHDWIEPITPPSEPASLNIPSAAMQVREPQGSVQVALPSAPADFRDVERGQELPNGSVLRTADNSSVAVLFGGVDSVRLAPNSQAAVQMTLAGGTRDVEVDIRNGMVFSKVGQRVGEKEAYSVHTPFGNATAHGTDYVTVVYPHRVDVWVAQGTVTLDAPSGPAQVTVSTGHEPLKVMRNPPPQDAATALAESAESLTALLNFIPMANQKLKALADRTASGAHLTPTEQDYVSRIRKVTTLIKLANVDAPPTPVAAAPPAAKPAPRALPVEPQPVAAKVNPMTNVVMAAKPSPAILKALAQIEKDSPKGGASAVATGTAVVAPEAKPYKTKPVVIVLPPAHFPKVAPDDAALTDVAVKMPKVKKTAPAKTTVAKTTDKATPVAAEKHYLRALPVDPAELAGTPAVKSTPPPAAPPPPKAAASADVDPNSLGAPLNPMRYPGLAPRPPEADVDAVAPAPAAPKYSVP